MQEFAGIDRKSLILMSALQIQPRASWSSLAKVLESNPTTLARRWRLLVEQGLAWITCSPVFPPEKLGDDEVNSDWYFLGLQGSSAYIEVKCHPGMRERVIEALVGDPRCWTLACTSGSRDLTVAVTQPSAQELDDFIQMRLGMLPGVITMRANPVRGFLQPPSSWRIGALTSAQRDALVKIKPRVMRAEALKRSSGPTELERAVINQLALDGRASATDIAAEVGYSVSSVNDAISSLIHSGSIEFRVDFAEQLFGWNVKATLSMRAPQSRMADIGAQLRRFSTEVREAVSMVGGANLQVHVWAKQMETIDAVEEMLDAQFPEVAVADRWISTRFAKRAGVILEHDGRKQRVISLVDGS